MRRSAVAIILVLLGVTTAVYGTQTLLFIQTLPAVPATLQVLQQNCLALVATAGPAPGTQNVAPGSSGGVSFGCGSGTTGLPAFKVSNDGVATPSFALPAPYTSVALIGSTTAPTSGCSTFSGPTGITSGTPFSFTGPYGSGNSFNYCVKYVNATDAGLPLFSVSWNQ